MRARLIVVVVVVAALGFVALRAPFAAAAVPNDTDFGRQWGMRLIGAPQAWDRGTGAGVTIAIADTGVDMGHPDLASKIADGGLSYVAGSSGAQDDHGHGTHVAGIAAAVTNNARGVAGAAPDAKILPLKVLDGDGSGNSGSADAAIRYAADRGAVAVNLSLSGFAQGITGASLGAPCIYAWSKGTLCVVAAGNDYITGSGYADDPVLVVSAVDENDDKPTYSSGVGEAMWGIAAPGGGDALLGGEQRIWSTCLGGTYCYQAGTSMSAPHVAGAYAVLRGLGLSPQAAVDRLLSSAKDIGSPGRDSAFGSGRLDMAAATAGLTPVTTTTTTPGGGTPTTGPGATTTMVASGSLKPVPRLAGGDRMETAVAISRDRFAAGSATAVVLSRADTFADALAGTPLAVARRAPLLLTGRESLDPRTRSEIERATGGDGTVILLGGPVALSDAIERELAGAGYTTVRFAGADRFDTAVRIARDGLSDPGTLFVADGTNYRDALVAGAAAPFPGAAVVLSSGRSMPETTRSYIASRSGARRYAIGGPAAAADPGATGIIGADAPDTSRKVAETFVPNPTVVGVTSRANFPDGLGGGAHVGASGGPLLITDPQSLSPTIGDYLASKRSSIARAFVYGGEAAISESVRAEVQRRIS